MRTIEGKTAEELLAEAKARHEKIIQNARASMRSWALLWKKYLGCEVKRGERGWPFALRMAIQQRNDAKFWIQFSAEAIAQLERDFRRTGFLQAA